MEDDAILTLVKRLARPHPSGGKVIERAAILASGPDSSAILRWIETHAGEAEAVVPAATRGGGLHGMRHDAGAPTPSRYVLPAEALSS